MMVARKKPKPRSKQNWLVLAGSTVTSAFMAVQTIATPDNIHWLSEHGGRLFYALAAVLAVVQAVTHWRKPN